MSVKRRTHFSGFNGFGQFAEIPNNENNDNSKGPREFHQEFTNCSLSWAYNAFSNGNIVTLRGFLNNDSHNQNDFKFEAPVSQISSNDNFCLVMLENGGLWKIDVHSLNLSILNFLTVEMGQKRNIFGEVKSFTVSTDRIQLIACAATFSIAITQCGIVYNIPSKIYEFPKHVKPKKLCCGFEHALVLTTNGDVYAWGNGFRGQLGNGEVTVYEIPQLVEPLAGIKIMEISAGGWQSAAISVFGDLYTWGSNINGQLGLPVYRKVENSVHRKNPTVFPLPQLIDLPNCCKSFDVGEEVLENNCNCDVVEVSCGARHTFVRRNCGRFFGCGWNEYGQLGIGKDNFLDSFVNFKVVKNVKKVICGPWSSVFMCEIDSV